MVAMEALETGTKALPLYSHRNSPRVYTQPQLFACLVLKTFFKTDYRGIVAMLADLPDLVAVLQLKAVPHYTTLQKASERLLAQQQGADALLSATVERFMKRCQRRRRRRRQRRRRGRRARVRRAAMDSSGLDCGHASRYYVARRAKGQKRSEKPAQQTTYKRYAKLEAVFDCDTHLILAAFGTTGPRPDTDRFVPLLEAALTRVDIATVLADAGYDSEPNHVHARERRGVRSVMPAEVGRPSESPPTGRWRRLMKQNLTAWSGFLYCSYGQRWQAECGISMIKRRLGASVAARSEAGQSRELMLLAITHNVLILYVRWSFLRSRRDPFGRPRDPFGRPYPDAEPPVPAAG
jgi:Transposase DDE domain